MQFSASLLYYYVQDASVISKGHKERRKSFYLPLILSVGVWNTLKQISGKRFTPTRELSAFLFPFLGKSFPDVYTKETRASSSICLCITIFYIALLFFVQQGKDTQLF